MELGMNVFLYAPELTGHPQVYCRVIGDILLEAGHKVFIAAASDQETVWSDWYDIEPFGGHGNVCFLDTRSFSSKGDDHLSAEELGSLQKKYSIDSTLFIEGEWFREQFIRIGHGEAPRLHGRNVAICSRANHWCFGEDAYTGEKKTVFGSTVRQTCGRVKRALFNRSESDCYFYETILMRKRVVDSLIVKDERIAEKYGSPVYWMPEIYRVFNDDSAVKQATDWDQFSEPIKEYIKTAGAGNVLLYFGTGTWYKGYDYFLKLAELDESTFALHAGAPERHEPNKPLFFDTSALRDSLRSQRRLFETNAFVESSELVDLLFNSIERFVSTHRLTLSSGTMLQALEAGTPVLVPGTGLVGWRVKKFGLGKTYNYLDEQDLARAWKEFREEPVDKYKERIQNYMKHFSRDAVRSFFLSQLCG